MSPARRFWRWVCQRIWPPRRYPGLPEQAAADRERLKEDQRADWARLKEVEKRVDAMVEYRWRVLSRAGPDTKKEAA